MLRLLIRRLNNFKLREKMVFSFVLFMLLPLVVVGSFVVEEFRKTTLQEALGQAEEEVSRLQRRAQDVLGVGLRISARLAVDPVLETLLTTHYSSTLDVFNAYHDFDAFHRFIDISPEVTGIHVYAENPTLLDDWEIRPLTPAERTSFWYLAARNHPNVNGWFCWTDEAKSFRAHLSLVRFLHYAPAGSEAVLVIDLDTTQIDTLVGKEGFETLVLDPNSLVVASSRQDLVGRPLTDPRLQTLMANGEPGTFSRQYQGTTSEIFLRDLNLDKTFNGLKIACVVNPEVILRPAQRITVAGLTVTALGAGVSLLFLWSVYTLFARRLQRLSRQLPLVASGDFDQVLAVDGSDEIGQLAARFNSMVVDIRRLMSEVKESHEARRRVEQAQSEIQLKMLTSQINPHFLFNVLESIRMKAHLRGEKEIASVVKLLGRLMRRNLEASGGVIPLSQELDNVRGYLEIEKFRLEEKLTYEFHLGPGADAVLVPPLIVEPLVENAVVHGLEPRYGGGRVTVAAQVSAGFLEVLVSDDGMGIASDRLTDLLADPDVHHIGLANIDRRLKLTYGADCGLMIESSVGQGTSVRFRLPVLTGDPSPAGE